MKSPSIRIHIVVVFSVLIRLFGTAQAEVGDKRQFLIDPSTTAINGIKITAAEHEIVKRLGRPKLIENTFSEVENKPSKYLHYDSMKIYVIAGSIYNLSCAGEKCQTDRGVKVGDSKEKVIEVYGLGNPPFSGARHDSLSYPLKGLDSYLTFLCQNGKVTEIEFFVDYV